ncbi:MAG: hypothetical protein CTY35_00230 [Methylotenera sp.]|uniref:IcmT/TraK family protein n=1 Tax=Methylotenera sp. TaxID=2051956 RepID=UPI000D44B31A|nr:MAG: hypothetical protein CTY38_00230 [Methylotenera sp.]PPD02141.1 MAG: hypothetical protein CTY35_00230 [Methylotenera sp.]
MWRDTARPLQIRGLGDAKILFPLVLLVFFPSWWTLGFCVASIITLMLINYKGFTFSVLMRWLRGRVIGSTRLARSSIQYRRLYGKKSSAMRRDR